MDGSARVSQAALWPLRSMLFVPGNRPEWLPGAIESDPDAVIIDLEDSVAPSEKVKARGMIRSAIDTLHSHGVAAIVKTNALPQGGLDDLKASMHPALNAVLLPKTASPEDIRVLHDHLSYEEGKAGVPHGEVSIIALPETAEALRFSYEIAKASSRVKGLLGGVGPIQGDIAFAAGFRVTVEGREQQYLQSKTILDSRAAGAIYPIAGVFASSIEDLAMVEMLVKRAKTMGFVCVHVIHPTHVGIANRIMRPSAEEVRYFEGLIAALEAGEREGRGAVRYEGAMIDLAMLATARSVVADAKRYSQPRRQVS